MDAQEFAWAAQGKLRVGPAEFTAGFKRQVALFFEPVQRGFQPADLLVEPALQCGLLGGGAFAPRAEVLGHRLHRLLLPGRDRERMNPQLAGQRALGLVLAQGGQHDFHFELGAVPPPFSDRLFSFHDRGFPCLTTGPNLGEHFTLRFPPKFGPLVK